MTKKRFLEKAPLIFTQAHLHFTNLPSKNIAKPNELESLHKDLMNLGLADRVNSDVKETSLKIDRERPDGYFSVSQEDQNEYDRLVCRGYGDTTAAEITQNSLVIKTTNYKNYKEFSELVSKVINAVNINISDTKNVLIRQIGIRYVDIILPINEKPLSDYLVRDCLPYHPQFAQGGLGKTQTVVRTGDNMKMIYVFEEIKPPNNSFPNRWLPTDLLELDARAALRLRPITEGYVPGTTYGLMSIDHRIDFPDTPLWDNDELLKELNSLYELSSKAFWELLTKDARLEWGEKNE